MADNSLMSAKIYCSGLTRPWLQGGTYGGSIIGCAAANATIDAIEEDGMLDNARERGVQLITVICACNDIVGRMTEQCPRDSRLVYAPALLAVCHI